MDYDLNEAGARATPTLVSSFEYSPLVLSASYRIFSIRRAPASVKVIHLWLAEHIYGFLVAHNLWWIMKSSDNEKAERELDSRRRELCSMDAKQSTLIPPVYILICSRTFPRKKTQFDFSVLVRLLHR